jgi:hypothetical protein
VLRVLGARHVAQGIATGIAAARRPAPGALRAGSAVDVAHATSAVLLALVDRRQRRPALLDGGVATALAVAGLYVARSDQPSSTVDTR